MSDAQQFSQIKSIKSKKRRAFAFSTVGTPDHIAPEAIRQKGYGQEIVWWSLGVIMFEMMIGYPPFFSEFSTEACKKILDWKKTFEKIRPEANISKGTEDILRKLINAPETRLGANSADEIKNQLFRRYGLDHIKENLIPTFLPELKNNYDTKNF